MTKTLLRTFAITLATGDFHSFTGPCRASAVSNQNGQLALMLKKWAQALQFQCNALSRMDGACALYRFDNVSEMRLKHPKRRLASLLICASKQGILYNLLININVLQLMLADLSDKQKQVCTYISFASTFSFSLQTMISRILGKSALSICQGFVFKLSYCLLAFYQRRRITEAQRHVSTNSILL